MDQRTEENKKTVENKADELAQGYTQIRDMLLISETTVKSSILMTEKFAQELGVKPDEKKVYEINLGIMHLIENCFKSMRVCLEWQKKALQHQSELAETHLQPILAFVKKYGPLLDELAKAPDMAGRVSSLDQ